MFYIHLMAPVCVQASAGSPQIMMLCMPGTSSLRLLPYRGWDYREKLGPEDRVVINPGGDACVLREAIVAYVL